MIEGIRTKKYKRLREFYVTDFGNVNYFIGRSGSGKSTILESIHEGLKNTRSSGIEFLKKGIWTNAVVTETQNGIKVTNSSLPGQKTIGRELLGISPGNVLRIGMEGRNGNILSDSETTINEINKLLGEFSQPQIERTPIFTASPVDPKHQNLTGVSLEIDGTKDIKNNDISGSVRHFFELKNKIDIFIQSKKGRNDTLIILIDEPETYMDPFLHKELPKVFQDIIETKWNDNKTKVQIFVSTHSPWLTSAAAEYDHQKVYVVENGKCKDPKGYYKGGMKHEISKMLGVGISDILPKNIFICEGVILEESARDQLDSKILNRLFSNDYDILFISNNSKEKVIRLVRDITIKKVLLDDGDYNGDNDEQSPLVDIRINGLVDYDNGKGIESKRIKAIQGNGGEVRYIGDGDTGVTCIEDILYSDEVLNILEQESGISFFKNKGDSHREKFLKDNRDLIIDSFFIGKEYTNWTYLKRDFELEVLTEKIYQHKNDPESAYKILKTYIGITN